MGFLSTFGPIALGVVLTGLLGMVGWLVKTVVGNAREIAELKKDMGGKISKVDAAERYVRRDDYVPQVTQMNVKLDAIGTMVARVDERTKEGA